MELRAETSVFDDKLLKEDINNAQETADNAQVIAGTTAQYFWFLEEIGSVPAGVGTGAHITNLTKEEFLSNPANGGGNLLARSNGIAIRDGLTELAYFSGTGAQIGKGNGYNSYFDAQSFQIRNGSTLLSKFTSNGVDIYLADDSINSVASFGTTARIGKDASGHATIKSDGLHVWTGTESTASNKVAFFGSTARIGKEANTNIQVSNSAISFYNNQNEYVSLTPNTTQDVGGCRLQTYYYHSGTKVNSYALTLDGNGIRVRMGTDDVNYHNFTSSGYTSRVPIYIYNNGFYLSTNNTAIYCKDTASANMDVLRLDSTNTLVIGYGLWNKNTSGYDTYVEGYNVYLRARNKCYSNGSQIATSDKRLKKDIVPISDKFKQLFMDLQPVEYRMEQSEDKDIHLGLTAQDVEMAFMKNNIAVDKYAIVDEYSYPEEKTRYKALAYTEFIPLCIKMIQSQQKEIDTLKGEINALHSN